MSSDINVQTFSGKVNITSNLLVGSSHLFVDTINNRVGLVTNTPDAGLHVNSNAYVHTDFRVGSGIVMNDTTGRITAGAFHGDGTNITGINSDSGSWVNGTDVVYLSTIGDKVGIGKTDPLSLLDIKVSSTSPAIRFSDSGQNRYACGIGGVHISGEGQRLDFYVGDSGSNTTNLDSGDLRMSIKHNGNVGIGTTSPGEKLQIVGDSISMTGAATSDNYGQLSLSSASNYTGGSKPTQLKIGIDHTVGSFGTGFIQGIVDSTHSGINLSLCPILGNVGIGEDNPSCKLTVGDDNVSVNSGGGVLGIRQKGDTLSDGITLTSSHANSTRIYKDANGHFNLYNTGGGQFTFQNVTGNVGIGTTSPDSSLHVNLGTNAGKQHIRATQTSFASGDTAGVRFGTGTWDAFIDHSHGSKDLLNFGFYRNPTRQVEMVLTHEGNVGIGTTGPGAKLDVNGTFHAKNHGWRITGSGGNATYSAGQRFLRSNYSPYGSSVSVYNGASSGQWSHSNGYFTFPTSGLYMITLHMFVNGTATGRYSRVDFKRSNGVSNISQYMYFPESLANNQKSWSTMYIANAGDFFYMYPEAGTITLYIALTHTVLEVYKIW